MDGGALKEQDDGEHQVVFFTFSGKISPDKVKKWNDSVSTLKKTFHSNLVGVTIRGEASLVKKRKVKRRKR
jgi:hypothetical protein